MKKSVFAVTCLTLATAGPIWATTKASPKAESAKPDSAQGQGNSQTAKGTAAAPQKPPIDRTILHVQVILDKLGFGPGVLDGRGGQSLVAALKGFQESRGLQTTGKIDQVTLRALYPYRGWRPTKTLALTEDVLRGPFINPLPTEPEAQAKLPVMAYRTRLEALAERFHTTPEILIALNSPETMLTPGTKVVFPNALPFSRDYKTENANWRQTLSSLNVSAEQPQAARLVVDKSEGVLRVYDAQDKLIGLFSATIGSSKDPLPLGNWKINAVSPNPEWRFDPKLIRTAKPGSEKAVVPPGPNNAVGVVWIDLSKEHYGIHGTAEPQTIGRAESNGCIRLTNWDAARVALMVKPGTPALFQA